MTIVSINKKSFEKEIGKLDEVMLEKIAMFGTPVDSFVDDETVDEFQIEVFPNRPDLLSYQGFKRAFLAYLDRKGKTGLIDYSKNLNKPLKNYEVVVDKSVKQVRPFTACAIVKNLELNDSRIKEIIDIQEKLHITLGRKRKKAAVGIYPLEKIVLPITFKALEPDKIKFQPLDFVPLKEMNGLQILQRHPTGRDYAHLLAGKERFPVFVDADNQVLSMPPIINSHNTGKVTENTKDVFVECSGFDIEVLKKCLNIVVTTLADFSEKIEVYQMSVIYGNEKITTPDLKPEKMKIDIENVNKLLGLKLNEKQLNGYLERMGFSFDEKKKEVLIPSYRNDILHEVDLIEDVAIAHGYDNFAPEIPTTPSSGIGSESKNEIIKRKISEVINGLGFLEISNYHLTTKDAQFKKMNFSEKEQKEKEIEVVESKTEFNILRNDLSHYLMKILSENVDVEYPHRIYEIGKVFLNHLSSGIKESERLGFALSLGNFTDAKQVMEYIFRIINVNVEISEQSPNESLPYFIDGRVASVKLNGKVIGTIGEIHPKVLRNWKLKMPVVLCEIELERIFKEINI